MEHQKRIYKLIDGSALPDEQKQIGYCRCDTHPGFLTISLLKEHECLRKQCHYLERFPTKPFWKERESRKKKREKTKEIHQKRESILNRFKELTSDIENFAVCGIEYREKSYYIRCVATQSVFLRDIAKAVGKEFKVCVRVYFVQNTYIVRQQIINTIKKREEEKK